MGATIAVSGVQHRTKFENREWSEWHDQPVLVEELANLFNAPALVGTKIKVTMTEAEEGQKSQWRRVVR